MYQAAFPLLANAQQLGSHSLTEAHHPSFPLMAYPHLQKTSFLLQLYLMKEVERTSQRFTLVPTTILHSQWTGI